jgi:hypothetical protein
MTFRTRIVALVIGGLMLPAFSVAQTARTGTLMREKLGHAQQILEALTTSNREQLARESAALARIAQSPQWSDLRTRDLATYADTFQKAVRELDAAAQRNDFDTAASRYTAMTTACYQCHRRLKDLRVAHRQEGAW